MENRPLITYSGEISVFQNVVPSLQRGIGAEAVEWKRPFGRSTRHVHLHPRFIPTEFDVESNSVHQQQHIISDTENESPVLTSLLDQPMLHTFWTDCQDVEIYRSTTKDAIQSWLNQIKSIYNVKEWLIIVVEAQDNRKTNKLLPRTSVLDKIKNDFAQKQTERCICITDPHKLDSKSTESLHSGLHRIRQLLLASYSKTLTKFEENMRAQREKRNELGWSFCHYFLLQEELAFVLDMLEVHDEALVQYDELDALFTQFVLNSHLTDTPQWLLSFQRFGDRWPALSLSTSKAPLVLNKIRETIRSGCVSLLNFRNYLFARQAILLLRQHRINELAQRSLSFLHNCIKELGILDVSFSEEGSISAWVFVSCLEILSTICGHGRSSSETQINSNDNNKEQLMNNTVLTSSDFSVYTAVIWDYAREKLFDMGKLSGLLPQSKPKSDHLHKVISLSAGLAPFDYDNNGNAHNGGENPNDDKVDNSIFEDSTAEKPIEKLKNALSSKEQFEKHYLELCELAMGTYKHIGRIRSARKVGLSLADYYIEAGQYIKATGFLADALKTFRDDKWQPLVVKILLKLAQCYQAINDNEKYIRTCAQLACCTDKFASKEIKEHYFNELMHKLENNDSKIISSMEDSFTIESIQVETEGKISFDSCDLKINLSLFSHFPKAIPATVEIGILPCEADHETHLQTNQQLSTSSANNSNMNPLSSSNTLPNNNNNLTGGGVKRGKSSSSKKDKSGHISVVNMNSGTGTLTITPPAKELVGRKESLYLNPSSCQEEDVNQSLADGNHALLKLDIGQHLDIKQHDKSVQTGRLVCHNSQKALRCKENQMKGEVQLSKTEFSYAAKSNGIILQPGSNSLSLFSKVNAPEVYRLCQISISINDFEILSPKLGCKHKFPVVKCPSTIELNQNQNLNLIAGIEQEISLNIGTGSNKIESGMNLSIRSSLGLFIKTHPQSPLNTELSIPLKETPPFSSYLINLIVKSELGPQKDTAIIEHKIIAKCPWSNEETKISIIFHPPFMSAYRLNSVGLRKFLQIIIQGLTEEKFTLSNHKVQLAVQNSQEIPLVPLNPRSQNLILTNGRIATYMWEVGMNDIDEENNLRFEFSCTFKTESLNPELYKYYICLQRFKTKFEIKAKIEPHHKGNEFCRVGNMCTLFIEISKSEYCSSDENLSNSLMYEVRADQHMWAICGRSSGVVSIENSESQHVNLDVMPMSPGFLPLPTVHLSKYIPADSKGGSSSNVPKLESFYSGQVFNHSRALQIHVLPPSNPVNNPSFIQTATIQY